MEWLKGTWHTWNCCVYASQKTLIKGYFHLLNIAFATFKLFLKKCYPKLKSFEGLLDRFLHFSDQHYCTKVRLVFRTISSWSVPGQQFSKVWEFRTWIRWLFCHGIVTHMYVNTLELVPASILPRDSTVWQKP